MKYKIEIWVFHNIIKTFEKNDIKKILKWYEKNYKWLYDNGGCTFYVYKNGEKMTFNELYDLGFYNWDDE